MNNEKIPKKITDVIAILQKKIDSDDVKLHEFSFYDKKAVILFVDSLVDKKAIAEHVLEPLKRLSETDFSTITKAINSPEIKTVENLNDVIEEAFDGSSVLLIDGFNKALAIGFKKFDMRAVSEPPTSVTLRGPREGFVECINTNISLLRRRIKSRQLKIEFTSVGRYSNTKVAICYVNGVVKSELPEKIKKKIEGLDIDAVYDSSYLAKHLTEHKTSLFKQIGTTEKPDTLASKIMEGRVAVIVDGSPFVLTLPYVVLEDFQAADDYYSSSYRATMVRILRLFSVLVAVLLPALLVAAELFHLQLLPLSFLLTIVNSIKGIPLSPSFEMFFTLMIFEILNEASIRMPKYVGMAVSIVGGLVLGETAVNAGIISAPALMIIAISGICLYTVPELVQTFSLLRLIFLCIAGSFGGYGMILIAIAIILYLVSFESYNVPLLAPFSPLIISDMKDALYKGFLEESTKRSKIFGSKNRTRLRIKTKKRQSKSEETK